MLGFLSFAACWAPAQVRLCDRGRPFGKGRELQRGAARSVQGARQAPEDGQAQGARVSLRHGDQLRRDGERAAMQRGRVRVANGATRSVGEDTGTWRSVILLLHARGYVLHPVGSCAMESWPVVRLMDRQVDGDSVPSIGHLKVEAWCSV